MAPFSMMSAGLSLLTKSFGLFSSVSSLASSTRVVQFVPAFKSFNTKPGGGGGGSPKPRGGENRLGSDRGPPTSGAGGPPKMPISAYIRFVSEKRPIIVRQYPGIKSQPDIMKIVAQQWRILSPELKQPFEEAYAVDRKQYKLDMEMYRSQLTPDQAAIQAAEKREKRAKRQARRKKRESTLLGKPKQHRTSFNIYMAEHYRTAKGGNVVEKMKATVEDYNKLLGHRKQVYIKLAEEDKVRYNTEMKKWEANMVDIGREDLIRKKSITMKLAVDRKKMTASKAETEKKPATKVKTAVKTLRGKSAEGGKTSAAKTVMRR